jgi:putative ABC transport system permease protein
MIQGRVGRGRDGPGNHFILQILIQTNKFAHAPQLPPHRLAQPGFQSSEEINGQKRDYHLFYVDEDYVPILQLQLVAGRNFSPDHPSDAPQAVLVNEAMVRAQGWAEPIGQQVKPAGEGQVVGVIKDFHTGSLHRPINPVILAMKPDHPYTKVVLVRMQTTAVLETVAAIEQAWKQFFPGLPLTVSFLDEQYEALYQRESRLRNVISIFSFLAILIGALGLLGLATFATEQRTKEVGIRKVLGASVPTILLLLSKDFMRLVLWANLLAWPLAWWGMREWLQNYAYRIELNLWLFVLPSLLVLLIALLTVGLKTWRAARANPVKSLRYEQI